MGCGGGGGDGDGDGGGDGGGGGGSGSGGDGDGDGDGGGDGGGDGDGGGGTINTPSGATRYTPSWVCSNLMVLMVMVVNEYILRERILPSTREGAGGEGVIDRHHQHPLGWDVAVVAAMATATATAAMATATATAAVAAAAVVDPIQW